MIAIIILGIIIPCVGMLCLVLYIIWKDINYNPYSEEENTSRPAVPVDPHPAKRGWNIRKPEECSDEYIRKCLEVADLPANSWARGWILKEARRRGFIGPESTEHKIQTDIWY